MKEWNELSTINKSANNQKHYESKLVAEQLNVLRNEVT